MTCKHIEKIEKQITFLISGGEIQKKIGPFLTIESIRKFMRVDAQSLWEKRWTNPEEWELEQISKEFLVIDEIILKEKLNKINDLLDQCDCFDKINEQLNKERKEKDRELSDKQMVLSSTQKENESLKAKIIQLQKKLEVSERKDQEENFKGKLSIKEKELGDFVDEQVKKKVSCDEQIIELEELFRKLIIQERAKNEERVEKTREKIVTVKSELGKKGMIFNDVKRVVKICEEIANLQFEQKQETKIEVLLIKN
jgi:hypothetical protein